jgi:hypothetical protein
MLEDRAEERSKERSDVRADEVIDVLVPGTVEAAAEHKPCIVVEQHESGFVQGADLANRLGSPGVSHSSLDGFAHCLSVAGATLVKALNSIRTPACSPGRSG